MVRRKRRAEERFTFVATIRSIERAYSIHEMNEAKRLDDEGSLIIFGEIQKISRRYQRHQGKQIEMALLCARSFSREHVTPAAEKPFLMSVSLRGENRSLGAYLPSDAFWSLPQMITSKAITHIEADFGPTRGGYGELLSLHFATAEAIEAASS